MPDRAIGIPYTDDLRAFHENAIHLGAEHERAAGPLDRRQHAGGDPARATHRVGCALKVVVGNDGMDTEAALTGRFVTCF